MTDFNSIAFNPDERRRKVLKQMKIVDGKPTSYSKFLRDYAREMSFTYHLVDGDTPKYRKIMAMFNDVAKKEWETFEDAR